MKKSNFNFIGFVLLFVLFQFLQIKAETPTESIKLSNNKIVDIIKKNKSQKQIEQLIQKVLEESTNFNSIVTNVKSSVCDKISEDKCKEFCDVFSELIKLSYSKKLAKYHYDKIEYTAENINGNTATVKTKIKVDNSIVKIDYELEKSNKKWLIVNYIIDDINTLDSYKKQFKRLIKKEPIEKIIQNLREKINSLKSGKDD